MSQNFDLYAILGDIKAEQKRIVALLADHLNDSAQSREKIYSLNELTDILQVSTRTLAYWKKSGILPCSQVGNKVWVTETQLLEFIEKNTVDSNSNTNTESNINKVRRWKR